MTEGRTRIITKEVLEPLIKKGMSGVEIARSFGVNPSSVSKALRLYDLKQPRKRSQQGPMMLKEAPLDTMNRLVGYNKTLQRLIDNLTREIKKGSTKVSLQVLIAALSEARKQIDSIDSLLERYYSKRAVINWMSCVTKAIQESCDEATKKKIFDAIVGQPAEETGEEAIDTEADEKELGGDI